MYDSNGRKSYDVFRIPAFSSLGLTIVSLKFYKIPLRCFEAPVGYLSLACAFPCVAVSLLVPSETCRDALLEYYLVNQDNTTPTPMITGNTKAIKKIHVSMVLLV